MADRFIQQLAQLAAAQQQTREKRAFYGHPGMMGMGGYGMGGMGGMPMMPGLTMPGYSGLYGGYRPMMGMGGYPGMQMGMMHGGMGMPGMGMGSGMGGAGMMNGGLYGAGNVEELRDQYDAQREAIIDWSERMNIPHSVRDNQLKQLNRNAELKLQRMQQTQRAYGPKSGRGQVYQRPAFEAHMGGGSYLGSLYPSGGGGYGGMGAEGPRFRADELHDQLEDVTGRKHQQERNLREGVGAPYSRAQLEAEWSKLQHLARNTSYDNLSTTEKVVHPWTGAEQPVRFGSGGAWYTAGIPFSSGRSMTSSEWKDYEEQKQRIASMADEMRKWREGEQTGTGDFLQRQQQRLQKQTESAEAVENPLREQQRALELQRNQAWLKSQQQQIEQGNRPPAPAAPPQRRFTPLPRAEQLPAPNPNAASEGKPVLPPVPTVPGQKIGSSRFLKPMLMDELVERALEAHLDKQALSPSTIWQDLKAGGRVFHKNVLPNKKQLGLALAAPLISGVGGAGVGALTAPQDYAPEGGHRGAMMGLAAGGGAALGGVAGKALGGMAGLATAKPGMRGIAGILGALLGGTAGGLGGAYAAHKSMPYKPWEAGVPSLLERLDENMRQRPPAPSFEPGYQGMATFLGESPTLKSGAAPGRPSWSNHGAGGPIAAFGSWIGRTLGGAGQGLQRHAEKGLLAKQLVEREQLAPQMEAWQAQQKEMELNHAAAHKAMEAALNKGTPLAEALAPLRGPQEALNAHRSLEPASSTAERDHYHTGGPRGLLRRTSRSLGQGLTSAGATASRSPFETGALGLGGLTLGGLGGISALTSYSSHQLNEMSANELARQQLQKYQGGPDKQASRDEDDPPGRGRSVLAGSAKGSLLGGASGAGLAALATLATALTAAVNHKALAGKSALSQALSSLKTTVPFGASLGALGGAGMGALHGYESSKNAGSETRRIAGGMLSGRKKRKPKPAPALENLDSLIGDLQESK